MKNIGKIGLAVLVMGFLANLLFGGGGDKDVNIPALIENGALVIDVRTRGEFDSGHIEGAINIPYDVIARAIDQRTTDKTASIIVYCRSGNRSSHAKRSLIQTGYTNVVDAGSFGRMQKLSGKPAVKGGS